ncbi:hypothetical protein LUX01_14460 [Streptomyces sudanensis]|uniref:hypothetical protein n=1 Tax=Streptomyces sudanensis TaxID=436397 RepID=UPI0020CBABE1|nr:hypothetical protein [Streptomyces sudanensis]MCP9987710.1 hypothetical protein [Streptomyces sudanensis]
MDSTVTVDRSAVVTRLTSCPKLDTHSITPRAGSAGSVTSRTGAPHSSTVWSRRVRCSVKTEARSSRGSPAASSGPGPGAPAASAASATSISAISARVGYATPSSRPWTASHRLTSLHSQTCDLPTVPSAAGNGTPRALRSPAIHWLTFCRERPVRSAISWTPTRSRSNRHTRSRGTAARAADAAASAASTAEPPEPVVLSRSTPPARANKASHFSSKASTAAWSSTSTPETTKVKS